MVDHWDPATLWEKNYEPGITRELMMVFVYCEPEDRTR